MIEDYQENFPGSRQAMRYSYTPGNSHMGRQKQLFDYLHKDRRIIVKDVTGGKAVFDSQNS